jgi:hypothetical protein
MALYILIRGEMVNLQNVTPIHKMALVDVSLESRLLSVLY